MTRRIWPIMPDLLVKALRGEIEGPLDGFPPDGRPVFCFWNSHLKCLDVMVESADFTEAEASLPLYTPISGDSL